MFIDLSFLFSFSFYFQLAKLRLTPAQSWVSLTFTVRFCAIPQMCSKLNELKPIALIKCVKRFAKASSNLISLETAKNCIVNQQRSSRRELWSIYSLCKCAMAQHRMYAESFEWKWIAENKRENVCQIWLFLSFRSRSLLVALPETRWAFSASSSQNKRITQKWSSPRLCYRPSRGNQWLSQRLNI